LIAESNRTLKFFSGGYSDRADNQDGRGTRKYEGAGKKNAAVEEHERERALASEVGVATTQVKLLVLIRVPISEKCRDAKGEVLVCWDRRY
jgi:hypothetical protein